MTAEMKVIVTDVIRRVIAVQEAIEDGDTAFAYELAHDLEIDLLAVRDARVTSRVTMLEALFATTSRQDGELANALANSSSVGNRSANALYGRLDDHLRAAA